MDNFTPDPDLHLIICYDTKSSLYLQASIMQLHEVDGKPAIQPLLVFSKEDTAEYLFPSIDGKFAMEKLPIPGGAVHCGAFPELEGFVLRQTQYIDGVPTLVYDLIIGEKGRPPGTGSMLVLRDFLDLDELRAECRRFMELHQALEGIYTKAHFEWMKVFTDEWGNTIQDHWVFVHGSEGVSATLNGKPVNTLPVRQWIGIIYWKYQGYL